MTKFRHALSAFGMICLFAAMPVGVLAQTSSSSGASIQAKSKGAAVSPSPVWDDSVDPAALKACREKMSQPSPTVKVGPLQPLRTANIRRRNMNLMYRSPNPVRESNLRMYAARVTAPNLFGVEIDHHQVCFFEKRGSTYRFVQMCGTKHRSTAFGPCDLSWIIPNSWYDRAYKAEGLVR